MLQENQNLSLGDRDQLFGYLEGGGKVILPEPQALLTEASGCLLGRLKMSKSYQNTISLREDTNSVAKKIKTMTTDPARVRRTIREIRTSALCSSCMRFTQTMRESSG